MISTVMLICSVSCRPAGQYTVTDSERIRKNTKSFESSCGSNGPQFPQQTTPPPVQADQTDAAGTTPTSNRSSTRFGVTVSVVDTTSVEIDQPPASNSLREEFDHLEDLVSTLNETVTSMAGGAPHRDGSDTSIVINNNGAFPEYAVVRKSQLVAADCGASYAVHLASQDGGYTYRSSTASTEGSPPPLPRPLDIDSEGSDTSIIKENLVALFGDEEESRSGTRNHSQSHSYSRNTHTGSNSSMSTACGEEGLRSLKGEGLGSNFHSNATMEVGSEVTTHTGEGAEFEGNFVELLKYGDSVDLTMV